MRIGSSAVGMVAEHYSSTRASVSESLVVRQAQAPPVSSAVTFEVSGAAGSGGDPLELPLGYWMKLTVIAKMIEALTGKKVTISLPGRGNSAGSQDAGAVSRARPSAAAPVLSVAYDRSETRVEEEMMSFRAAGRVVTTDGREITFSAELSMSRRFVEENHVSIRIGTQPKDPLVLNLSGAPIALGGQEFSLDLDLDGEAELLRFLSAGAGFLVLDRDGDGRVTDGSELFGPTTGNGFVELAMLDSDGNGWIDEGDPVFADLRIWLSPDSLPTLAETGVGAICIDSISTPFSLRNAGNEETGQVRSSGVYLFEQGGAGAVHQIDIMA